MENNYKGTAVILCTGPSVLKVEDTIPEDAYIITVNRRGVKLCDKLGLPVDMVVANDPWEIQALYKENYSDITHRISREEGFTDHDVKNDSFWFNGLSSSTAISIACYMGFDEVLLYGVDWYKGGDCYFNRKEFDSFGQDRVPLDHHIDAWETLKDGVPRHKALKVMSGHPWLRKYLGSLQHKNEYLGFNCPTCGMTWVYDGK